MENKSQKKIGNEFERRIKFEAKLNPKVFVVQIPPEVRYIKGKWIRIKGPFDFSLGISGKAVYVDTKVTHDDKFYLKSNVFRDKKIHQLAHLLSAQEKGCVSGYLIEFATHGLIGFCTAKQILEAHGTKKSILREDCICQDSSIQINFHKLFGIE